MHNVELANALLKSHAYKSLSIEAEVFDIVCKYFQRASRSPYFTDIDTDKLREIDITASVRYCKNCKNRKNAIFCNLYFFIECKSNKSFNVIAEGKDLNHSSYLYDCRIWAGDAAKNIDLIQKIVVIDSPLWERVNDNTIESIKYFRLLRHRIDSIHIDFVDVVSRQHFQEYINAVNKHYKKNQKEKKLTRIF